jgi:peroxiredoxin Q/BCP
MVLKIGDKAPEFKVNDENGKEVKLSDFQGKKVILYFYPKDQTPGCIAQSCNLRDHHQELNTAGYVVLGISSDSQKSHLRFIDKQNLPFTLLADEDKKVHDLYGTWAEKKLYGRTYMGTLRTTFVIDEKGVIENIISKVKTKDHTAQILDS